MLYDLNLPWSTTTTPADLERRVSFLSSLGYHTIALNHSFSTVPPQISNPIPTVQPFTLPSKTTLLSRCTLTISDPSQNHRLPQLVTHYDLVAVRPTTEKAFLAACLSLSDVSIISLDLSIRYPFHFKPKPLMTAVNRGVRFEICYSQVVTGDAERRRNVIANVMAIVRGTRGRGLVVSSGAEGVLGVRPPADVVNLLSVWGLARERGLEAMGVNPRGVVVNEGVKRRSFRGVVEIIDGGELPKKPVEGSASGKPSKGEKGKQKTGGAGKESEASTPQSNAGKRKSEEPPTSADGTPTMSKRQAKRMRLAMLKAENEGSSSNLTTPGTTTPEPSSTAKSKSNG